VFIKCGVMDEVMNIQSSRPWAQK